MIALVFTGGTISMRHDASGGAVPSLSGRDIVAMTKGLDAIARLEVDEWGAYPGPHMTPSRMWALRARILEHIARPDVIGVVITHGTDSMEETAYLLARSVRTEKPIVLTGAMRTSSDLGWDGPANLAAAVRVAASDDARGTGAVVVMGDRIFSGLDVAKVHTHMTDAFESPGLGPLGVVDDGRVLFRRALPASGEPLDPPALAEPVEIVVAYPGADSRLLDAARTGGRGVVIAAMGRGNVPPEMVDGIDRWIADGKPVVVSSRAVRGRVGATYGYPGGGFRLQERGAILSGHRRPPQARLDLMLALGSGMSSQQIRAMMEGEPS